MESKKYIIGFNSKYNPFISRYCPYGLGMNAKSCYKYYNELHQQLFIYNILDSCYDLGPYLDREDTGFINHLGFMINTYNIQYIINKIERNEELFEVFPQKSLNNIGLIETCISENYKELFKRFGFIYLDNNQRIEIYDRNKIRPINSYKAYKPTKLIETDRLYFNSSKNFFIDIINLKTDPNYWLFNLEISIGITSLGKIVVFNFSPSINLLNHKAYLNCFEKDIRKMIKALYNSSLFNGIMFKYLNNLDDEK